MRHCTFEESKQIISGLKSVIPLVREFQITTTKKSEHKTKLEEARKLLYKCSEIHFIYEPEYYYRFTAYKKAIELNKTKKELDALLSLLKRNLGNDIVKHIYELENLEYSA